MALIVCPNCGEKITDQSAVCIHCGHKLEGTRLAFENLDKEQQDTLLRDFLSLHPHMNYGENSIRQVQNALGWATFLSVFVLIGEILLLTIALLLHEVSIFQNINVVFLIIAILLSLVSFLLSLVVYAKTNKKTIYNVLLAERCFQKWLDEEQNIIYTPKFRNRQFQIQFDMIKIKGNKTDGNRKMS